MKKEQNNSFVKERITHTLLNLMKHHSFEEITITEIMKHGVIDTVFLCVTLNIKICPL